MWFQQEMATALANLSTMTATDSSTLDSVTSAMPSSNTDIASFKSKLKTQSKILNHGN